MCSAFSRAVQVSAFEFGLANETGQAGASSTGVLGASSAKSSNTGPAGAASKDKAASMTRC